MWARGAFVLLSTQNARSLSTQHKMHDYYYYYYNAFLKSCEFSKLPFSTAFPGSSPSREKPWSSLVTWHPLF